MAYYAAQIANYFIERGQKDGVTVDPLKVQKLVYLAHGWYLHFHHALLVSDQIEAWKYGPVVPGLYFAFRRNGAKTIAERAKVPDCAPYLNEKTISFLNQIWHCYGRWSGIDLSMLTHETNCAWDLARRTNDTPWNDAVIPNELIEDEFRGRRARH